MYRHGPDDILVLLIGSISIPTVLNKAIVARITTFEKKLAGFARQIRQAYYQPGLSTIPPLSMLSHNAKFIPTYEELFKLCLFCDDSYRGIIHHFFHLCVQIWFPAVHESDHSVVDRWLGNITTLSVDRVLPSMTQDSWYLAQRRFLLPLLMDFIWLSLKCFFPVAGPSFILSLELRWLLSSCRSISLKETSASN